MGAPCEEPQGHGETQARVPVAPRPLNIGFCTSLQAPWHLVVQDVPGALRTCCHAITLELGTRGSPTPVMTPVWKAVLCAHFFFFFPLYCLICCLCCHCCISRSDPPKERISSVSHHSVRNIAVRQSLRPGYCSGHQTPLSHRANCGFFP